MFSSPWSIMFLDFRKIYKKNKKSQEPPETGPGVGLGTPKSAALSTHDFRIINQSPSLHPYHHYLTSNTTSIITTPQPSPSLLQQRNHDYHNHPHHHCHHYHRPHHHHHHLDLDVDKLTLILSCQQQLYWLIAAIGFYEFGANVTSFASRYSGVAWRYVFVFSANSNWTTVFVWNT